MEVKRDITGLVNALRDRDTDIRQRAADALVRIGDLNAVNGLVFATVWAHIKVRITLIVTIRALINSRCNHLVFTF
jgi:HEAT repeat protein